MTGSFGVQLPSQGLAGCLGGILVDSMIQS